MKIGYAFRRAAFYPFSDERGPGNELPPKEVLLAQLAGGLQAPMARLAGGASNLIAGFARAVDALRAQREGAQS